MKILFFSLLFFSSSTFAWEITLDRTNHSGFRLVDILKQEKGEYAFNGKKLGKTLPAEVLNSWKEIEKGPAKSSRVLFCAAGNFSFLKTDGHKKTHREGCTEGEAYGRMIKNIDDIRTYAKGL